METGTFSVLNYRNDVFSGIASGCKKIRITEIEELLGNMEYLEGFTENLVDQALKKRATSANVDIHFFLNGESKKPEETNFSRWCGMQEGSFRRKLAKLDTSFRVTNLQNIDPVIRSTCAKFSRRFKIPMTCNMYVSPGRGFDCLGKHTDIQETFVFQLVGHKLWKIFQDEEGNDLRLDYENVNRDGDEPYRTLTLSRGETLYTPSNLVHKVECDGDEPSVHLNFALNLRNKSEFCRFFFKAVETELAENFDFNRPMDRDFLESFCDGIKTLFSSVDVRRIRDDYEKKQFMESVDLAKRGRAY